MTFGSAFDAKSVIGELSGYTSYLHKKRRIGLRKGTLLHYCCDFIGTYRRDGQTDSARITIPSVPTASLFSALASTPAAPRSFCRTKFLTQAPPLPPTMSPQPCREIDDYAQLNFSSPLFVYCLFINMLLLHLYMSPASFICSCLSSAVHRS